MAPYFQTAKSFAEVSITDDGVDTDAFLIASDDFVKMFDLLGSGVFGFVQTDLRNNISGVRGRYLAAVQNSGTLEKLVLTEAREAHKNGTACLVRLVRGLLFTCQALQNMQRDRDVELHVCFRRSFDVNLSPRLSWIVRSVVSVAIRAVPHREQFYNCLTEGGSHEVFDVELTKWLDSLELIVNRMKLFLEQGGHGLV